MFEAREFLRKRLVGKRVHATVDYIQAASGNFPEKTACTVTFNSELARLTIESLLIGLTYLQKHRRAADRARPRDVRALPRRRRQPRVELRRPLGRRG